jgi:hypothetical protein
MHVSCCHLSYKNCQKIANKLKFPATKTYSGTGKMFQFLATHCPDIIAVTLYELDDDLSNFLKLSIVSDQLSNYYVIRDNFVPQCYSIYIHWQRIRILPVFYEQTEYKRLVPGPNCSAQNFVSYRDIVFSFGRSTSFLRHKTDNKEHSKKRERNYCEVQKTNQEEDGEDPIKIYCVLWIIVAVLLGWLNQRY